MRFTQKELYEPPNRELGSSITRYVRFHKITHGHTIHRGSYFVLCNGAIFVYYRSIKTHFVTPELYDNFVS